jgi:hypothetical protein
VANRSGARERRAAQGGGIAMNTFKKRALPCVGRLVILATLVLSGPNSFASAQVPASPEATVQRFYAWYLHALNQNQDPLGKHQAELSKFVTQRLMRSLNRALKRPDGIDADFFIDAQDWDETWEKNISASKALIQGQQTTVSVTLKGGPAFGNKTLKVGLRKESGDWTIDSINDRMNP